MSPTQLIFLSYSRRDAVVVATLAGMLEAGNLLIWIDTRSLKAGEVWRLGITKAIEDCDRLLVFWCSHSRASREVTREYQQGLGLGKTVVPVLLDSTPLREDIAVFNAKDMRPLTEWPHRRQRWGALALAGLSIVVLGGLIVVL